MELKMDTIETGDLIELVKKNHQAVESNYAKLSKSVEDLPGIKSQLTNLEQKMARRSGGGFVGGEETKSFGQTVADSEAMKHFIEAGMRGVARVEIKTVNAFTTATTPGLTAPQIITDPTILPRRRMTIRNLLAQSTTTANAVWFPRMTARQNMAATVAETAQKPLSDASFAQISTPVVVIAHLMQLSRQILDDAPALAGLVQSEMEYGRAYTEEAQILNGDGSGANLLGLIPQATAFSAAFSITGETGIDRIAMAILQSELALLPANGIVMNPTDWRKLSLQKSAQGEYILGSPARQTTPSLWGLPVVATPAMAAGYFLVGAFDAAAMIFDRLTAEFLISSENKNNWEINELTARMESRLALAVKQPLALIYGTMP
jgi:HK97 family phage major capsid protein